MTKFFGLDIETSGTDWRREPWRPAHRTIQVGVAEPFGGGLFPAFVESEYVVWHPDQIEFDPKAMEVNKIDRSLVTDREEASTFGSFGAAALLVEPYLAPGWVPVGWNVAHFDTAFLKADLIVPFNAWRRTCDLNAVCFSMGHKVPLTQVRRSTGRPSRPSAKKWKVWAQKYATIQMLTYFPHLSGKHDAAWDAAAALFSLEFLRGCMSPESAPHFLRKVGAYG